MVMLLQRKPLARLHDDALDLMALAVVDRLIGTPGPMHLEVLCGHLGRDRLHLRDQPLQPVGVLLARHQHGVLGGHHHEIVDAFQRDQRLVGRDIAVAGILEHGGALRGIALRRPCPTIPTPHARSRHRTSRTDTGTTAARDGLFHHRIVDRDRLGLLERVRIERDEAEIAPGLADGVA